MVWQRSIKPIFRISRCNVFGDRKIGIRTIKEGPVGVLWLGTYGAGLIRYDYLNNQVDYQPMEPAPHIVTDILVHSDSVWVASLGEGLFLYNTKSGTTNIYAEKNGLSSSFLSSLLRDKEGCIWIASSKGIDKLNPKTLEVVSFNSGDGLQQGEFMERAAIGLPNGNMVFAGFGGINVFNPSNVAKDEKCPPVKFTKLTLFNEPIAPFDRHGILRENISLAKEIELAHHQSVFTLDFNAVSFVANEKIQYAYMLEGAEKQWNYLGHQNSITFRNLKPGKYVLKVKASSPDGVWGEDNIASLAVVVHPPFWATGWAYLIYMLFFGAVVYFIWLMLNMRLNASNQLKLERAAREKDEELHQEKIQFFTNISHEFRTPLTLLLAPLELMHQEEQNEERKTSFKLMIKNANRLLAMVNQLLDFRKAERGQMRLRVQQVNVIEVVSELMGAFESLSNQKNIKLDFVHHPDAIMAWMDVEFINKSLMNLLSNAFKFTPNGGHIEVAVSMGQSGSGKNALEIVVTDNGSGIRQEDIRFVFNRFYQGAGKSGSKMGSGIGLHLVKTLIEMHHGTIGVESIPNVKTSFAIVLPMDKADYAVHEFADASVKTPTQTAELSAEMDFDGPLFVELASPTRSNGKHRLLVVEDNDEIRAYLRSILEPRYEVEEAENGVVGLEMAKEKEFDLVITDLMMPELDGTELCRQIKESIETSHIPIIMLTAKSDIQSRIEGLGVGADSYITKPFHPQHVLVRVEKLIALRNKLKEVYSRKISFGSIQPEPKTESPDELFLQKAIAIIAEKMVESEFNGDKLALELGISRMGLHRKIKAITGQSTGELIRNIRLNKACELLRGQEKNVSEICYEVGFNSPSYFTSCFTEVYKMPPSEYAKAGKI
jgi:signal transduction histidine kinase/CheY-like chemotaxis protein/AraC-like DNA-binding protein